MQLVLIMLIKVILLTCLNGADVKRVNFLPRAAKFVLSKHSKHNCDSCYLEFCTEINIVFIESYKSTTIAHNYNSEKTIEIL